MTLRGVGVDVVDLLRFRSLIDRWGQALARRWFDTEELDQPGDRALNLARSFAVKEAVLKALRPSAVHHPRWREIVAVGDGTSMSVRLSGLVKREADAWGVRSICVTTAVRDQILIATAIAEVAQTSGTSPSSTGLS